MSSLCLSYELLDLILDDFDVNLSADRQALCCCALADVTFRRLSQQKIFKCIELRYSPISRNNTATFAESKGAHGAQFLDIITTNPGIADYVENASFKLTFARASGTKVEACSNENAFSLYQIAPKLRKLKEFSVTSLGYLLPWDDVDETTQRFFQNISVQVLKLDVSLFGGFPFWGSNKLHSLRVRNLLDWQELTRNEEVPVPKAQLESLDVGIGMEGLDAGFGQYFKSPSSPFDLSHLRSLTISCQAGPEINDILAICSATLEELFLQTNSDFRRLKAPSLSSLRKLRLLKVQSFAHDLKYIASLLESLPHSQQCHQPTDNLEIILNFENYILSISKLPWNNLAKSLFQLNTSGHLERVKFIFPKISDYDEETSDTLEQNDALKNLRQSKFVIYEIVEV